MEEIRKEGTGERLLVNIEAREGKFGGRGVTMAIA